MRHRASALLLPLLLITGCDDNGQTQQAAADLKTYDVAYSPSFEPGPGESPSIQHGPNESGPVVPTERLPVSLPRIAYSYGYTFRLSSDAVAAAQERHLQLCQRMGPARCRVVRMQRGTQDGVATAASLTLQVAAAIAADFGSRLVAVSADAGGETIDREISAEDLSGQMIDSDARIRTRETLIRRLTGLLETRSGNIAQAVEAERAINVAQEELEAARAALSDMRARVAMSKVEISYQARAPAGIERDNVLADAFRQVGSIAVNSLAALILVFGTILPWLVLASGIFWIARRRRQRPDEALEG